MCGTKRSGPSAKSGSRWLCSHLKKGKVKKHPVKVENMSMEEKIALPGPLVASLLQPMVQKAKFGRVLGVSHKWVAACTKLECRLV